MDMCDVITDDGFDDGWKPIEEAPLVHGYRCYVEGKDGHREHGFYMQENGGRWIDERGGTLHPIRFKEADPDESSKWFLSDKRPSDVILKKTR